MDVTKRYYEVLNSWKRPYRLLALELDCQGGIVRCPALDGANALEVLNSAYRKAALSAHPDKGGTNEAFKELAAAFDLLRERRREHDRRHAREISDLAIWCEQRNSRPAPPARSADQPRPTDNVVGAAFDEAFSMFGF